MYRRRYPWISLAGCERFLRSLYPLTLTSSCRPESLLAFPLTIHHSLFTSLFFPDRITLTPLPDYVPALYSALPPRQICAAVDLIDSAKVPVNNGEEERISVGVEFA